MKLVWMIAATISLALAGTASAADISNISGQSCGDATGTWHFINNKAGSTPGSITATWSSGDSCTTAPSKVLTSTQHFYCTASGTLESATTNLPGRLVLSDFSCGDVKEPCNPKTDPNKCEPAPK